MQLLIKYLTTSLGMCHFPVPLNFPQVHYAFGFNIVKSFSAVRSLQLKIVSFIEHFFGQVRKRSLTDAKFNLKKVSSFV